LTQSPRPEGDTFNTTYTQSGCGSYRLSGTFIDSDSFSGTWTGTFSGGCGSCGNQDYDVTGVRTP
jgi:hypothetical protein